MPERKFTETELAFRVTAPAQNGRSSGRFSAGELDYGRSPNSPLSKTRTIGSLNIAESSQMAGPPLAEHLLRISNAITSASDWSSALSGAANACVGILGASRSTLLLWDPAHDELEVAADCAAAGRAPIVTGVRIALERWPTMRATLKSGEPNLVDDCETHLSTAERKLLISLAATNVLVVPLSSAGEIFGLLLLFGGRSTSFKQFELAHAREVASVVGPGLANARLLDRSRRIADAQAALFRVSQAAISIHDRTTMLREITSAATKVIGCDAVAIEVWHRETDEIETISLHRPAEHAAHDDMPKRYALRDFRSMRFALEQQTALEIHPQQPGQTAAELEMINRLKAESLLIVPMTIGGETIGALSLAARRSRAFDRDALTLAQKIAAQTALAIQHSHHVERTKQLAEEQAALLRVSRAVISGRSLRDVLKEIGRTAVMLEGVDICRIWLWHRSVDEVELVTEESLRGWRSFYQRGNRYSTRDWPNIAAVLTSGEQRNFQAADSGMSARERANHVADGVKSLSVMPILAGDECLGCLALYSGQTRRFTADALRFGQELAEQAAHAIDRARLYQRLRVRAETDGLTTLLNHRAAFETLDQELTQARKNGSSVGVIVVDLDDFKLFNDTHGHLVGDSVLVEVARVLRETVREGDQVARYGGDEFLVILPGANTLEAQEVAQQVVERMSRATVDVGQLHLPIRCSVGVANYPRDAKTRPELIAFADSSMYAAKELGGGQVGSIRRGTRSLEVSTLGALSGLVRAVDRKDRYTKDHSDLVAEYAVRFGRSMRMAPEKIEALELAGELHDVGKIAVPDSILRKPGYLTPEEEAMIRQHVVFSELMIKGVPHLEDVLAAVANHHERWDGSGYPHGKFGSQIPLLGRILALSDALAAMTYDRPYRKGRSLQEAVDEIRRGAGTQFDPDLVEPFISAVTSETGLLSDAARREWSESPTEYAEVPGTSPLRLHLRNTKISDILTAAD